MALGHFWLLSVDRCHAIPWVSTGWPRGWRSPPQWIGLMGMGIIQHDPTSTVGFILALKPFSRLAVRCFISCLSCQAAIPKWQAETANLKKNNKMRRMQEWYLSNRAYFVDAVLFEAHGNPQNHPLSTERRTAESNALENFIAGFSETTFSPEI